MVITKYDLLKNKVFDTTIAPLIGGDYNGSSAIVDAVVAGKLKLLIRPGTYDISSMSSYPSGLIMFGLGLDSEFTLTGQTPQTPFFTLESTKPIKNNFEATTNPTTETDTSLGYQVGSTWINVSTDEAYLCVDATISGASWIGSTAELHSELNGLGADDHTQYHLTDGTRPITGPIVTTGGNARGTNSIDLQLTRTLATQVASGNYSVILGGTDNTAANPYDLVYGNANDTTGATDGNNVLFGDTNTIGANGWNVILGGQNNSNSGKWSFIGSGDTNNITSDSYFSSIICGQNNTVEGVNSDYSIIVGGQNNNIKHLTSTTYRCIIGGGSNNDITNGDLNGIFSGTAHEIDLVDYSVILGGKSNDIIGIAGGGNQESNTIVGGTNNIIRNLDSTSNFGQNFIGAGWGNVIEFSVYAPDPGSEQIGDAIVAGYYNKISHSYPYVGEGYGESSFIGGGKRNVIDSTYGYQVIGGGQNNKITGTAGKWATIGGGEGNTITNGNNSTIAGGNGNSITGEDCGILGCYNTIVGDWNYIIAEDVTINAEDSGAFGGYGNSILSNCSTAVIVGGVNQSIGDTVASASTGIFAGESNDIDGASDQSIIIGGEHNSITAGALKSAIVGGSGNNISNSQGYHSNAILGSYGSTVTNCDVGVIVGGDACSMTGNTYNGIFGGSTHTMVNGDTSAILGGYQNTMNDTHNSLILGGEGNTLTETNFSTVIGRKATLSGTADRTFADVYGTTAVSITVPNAHIIYGAAGYEKKVGIQTLDPQTELDVNGIITHAGGVISSGGNARGNDAIDLQVDRTLDTQVAAGSHSVIAGGNSNELGTSADYSFIGGGLTNKVTGYLSVVVGGDSNTVSSNTSSIVGGENNTVNSALSTIIGGSSNDVYNDYELVWGNANDTTGASDGYNVLFGDGNLVSAGGWNTVLGGWHNDAGSAYGGDAVVGGYSNTANGGVSFVGSGEGNTATGEGSFIGGGVDNIITATGNNSSICGGDTNGNAGDASFIGGGQSNNIASSATYAVIVGGTNNNATASVSTIVGGEGNNANGYAATVIGGSSNTAAGDYSSAFGRNGNIQAAADRTFADIYSPSAVINIATPNAHIIYGSAGYEKKVGIQTLTPNTTLDVKGGLSLPTRTITSAGNTSATINDYTIRCDATAGDQTIDLPTAASAYNSTDGTGLIINIKKVDASSNKVTIDGNSIELVDYQETEVLNNRGESLTLQSNGTSWDII
jgi:hypothetical protein